MSGLADQAPVAAESGIAGQALRTNPLSFAVKAVAGLQNSLVPMVFVFISMRDEPWAILAALAIGLAIAGFSAAASYLQWSRLTYMVGEEDIRVESGILSRAARSVPFERIQDVSLEQSLIPRLFGLVQVKFETGAGGGDDLALSYLSEAEGERLREVIKARKDGVAATANDISEEIAPSDVLFAMDTKRLVTFGFFEFSLAAFAVLAGLFQYADSIIGIQWWEAAFWSDSLSGPGSWIAGLGAGAQIIGIIAGALTFVVVGSATGLVRTVLRDWGFVLERTEKGFRRRRGLLTRTDVVMPVHRVQAVKMSTGFLRRRFGWFGLKFVSLAQDSGSASHDVAPFGTMAELDPIARAASFAIDPEAGYDWQRGSRKYRTDKALIVGGLFAVIAIFAGIVLAANEAASPALALIPMGVGLVFAARQLHLWHYDLNACDAHFLFVKRGWLSPKLDVASRVKLQSVEIARGPIARRRGYASLRLGLAGGTLSCEGLPLERAHELRRAILASVSQTDFSELAG
ncbi:MAG: PH domain-containing protein [Pontixanthobacter sp.]